MAPAPCPLTDGGNQDGDMSALLPEDLRNWEAGNFSNSGTRFSLDSLKCASPFILLWSLQLFSLSHSQKGNTQ